MAQTIKLKRSATQGAIPSTSDLALGEVAINTYDGKMYIKKSVGGVESIVPVGGSDSVSYLEAGMTEYEYTATSSQTTFSGSDNNSVTLSYTANSIMVFLNGVLQDDGVDYTATNGTSVVFTSALTANDEVRIVAIDTVASTSTLQNPTKLDAITTVNAQAAYSLTVNSSAYTPSSETALIVSLNGITQEPGDSFTVSGSTITFSPALVTGDVVDYIVDMGRAVTIGEYSGDLVVGGELEVIGDIIGDLRGPILFKAQAGENLTKCDAVYISGISGNTTVVSKADADDAAKMPAFGIVAASATSGQPVDIYTFGTLSSVDTSTPGWSIGDELYVSTTPGALTNSAPTGESASIQKIAKVTRVDNSAGSIKIMGAGRSNATPNLNDGNIFIGNASNQAVSAALNTSIVPENTNLYYTDARVDSRLSSGNVATIETSGNVTVGGNLTVNGTTTTIDTTNLNVEDKNITLNYSTGDSSATADGAGITIQDAVNSTTDATLLWNATGDKFEFSHALDVTGNITATGEVYTDSNQNAWAFRATTGTTSNSSGLWFTGTTARLLLRDSSGNIKTMLAANGTNAENVINNNTIWHAGNDGSGSGLDADTIDGIQGSNLLTLNGTHTQTGTLTFQNTLSFSTSYNEPIVRHGSQGPYFRSDGTYIVWEKGSNTGSDSNFYINNFSNILKDNNIVWHAGNDGSGSGLDADTLDGVQASSFLRDVGSTYNGEYPLVARIAAGQAYSHPNLTYKGDTGHLIVSGTSPVIKLNDTNATNTTNLSTWLGFYINGTETGYVGYGTSATNILYLANYNGEVRLNPTNGNATVNGNRILTTADEGSGNGIDADTVDGVQASSFLRSDTSDSASGNLAFTGSIRSSGYSSGDNWLPYTDGNFYFRADCIFDNTVDFNSTFSAQNATFDAGTSTTVTVKCDDAGEALIAAYGDNQGTGRIYVGQSGSYGGGIEYNGDNSPSTSGAGADYIVLYRNTAGTLAWTARNFYNSNDWSFRGNITAYASDERLKENIQIIPNALEKVASLKGVTFDWRADVEEKGFLPSQKHETGVIAQDVAKVVPDAAVPAPFDENYLTVQHEKLIPLLIEAIKELKAEIEELKNGSSN